VYQVKLDRAVPGGMIGAAAMSLTFAAARALGASIELEKTAGILTGALRDSNTVGIGLLVHLMFGGLLGFVYARIIERVGRGGPNVGALIAIAHVTLVLAFLGVCWLARRHLPPSLLALVGFIAELGPFEFVTFVVAHLFYGAIVGAIYGAGYAGERGRIRKSRPSIA
jgi:hypothetical protein